VRDYKLLTIYVDYLLL